MSKLLINTIEKKIFFIYNKIKNEKEKKMKKIGKFFANVLIVAYAVIAIVVTVLLLSYNDYHCSVIGGYTFILVTDDELEPNYPEGSLVLVKGTKAKNINPGDHIFLYRNITSTQFEIKYAEVLMKDSSKGEYDVQYILEGNTIIDHEDVIGSAENVKVIPNLGTILSILESRYGYLFLIVVVSFIAFLYEIYELIMEIKYGEREEDEEDEEDEEEYEDEEEEMPKKKVATQKKATASKSTTTRKNTTSKSSAAKKTTTSKSSAAKKTTTSKATATKKATSTKTSK